uniref:PX domain-containing protein n=1 Tax=Eptatretus burgeri TaxID=7764 RepID=A0A8C4QPJ3_EPTBU
MFEEWVSEDFARFYTVSDTRRHERGHTEYKITAHVSPSQSLWLVIWKRCRDVKRLHKALFAISNQLRNDSMIFPPFSKTKSFGRFNEYVIEERRQQAEDLLQYSVTVPKLHNSSELKDFFKVDCSLYLGHNILCGVQSCEEPDLPVSFHSGGMGSAGGVTGSGGPFTRAAAYFEQVRSTIGRGGWSWVEGTNVPRGNGDRCSSPDGSYLVRAARQIQQALEKEQQADYEGAFGHYQNGVEVLLQGVQADPDPGRRDAVKRKTRQYLTRAEDLFTKHLDSTKAQTVVYDVVYWWCVTNSSCKQGLRKSNAMRHALQTVLPQAVPNMVRLERYFTTDYSIFLLLQYVSGEFWWGFVEDVVDVSGMCDMLIARHALADAQYARQHVGSVGVKKGIRRKNIASKGNHDEYSLWAGYSPKYHVGVLTPLVKTQGGKPDQSKGENFSIYDDQSSDSPCGDQFLRFGTWNVGTMTGRSGEVVETLVRRRVDICCVQETRWKGSGVRMVKGRQGQKYKFMWQGCPEGEHGVDVMFSEEFVDSVVSVIRVSERLMMVRIVIGKLFEAIWPIKHAISNMVLVNSKENGDPATSSPNFFPPKHAALHDVMNGLQTNRFLEIAGKGLTLGVSAAPLAEAEAYTTCLDDSDGSSESSSISSQFSSESTTGITKGTDVNDTDRCDDFNPEISIRFFGKNDQRESCRSHVKMNRGFKEMEPPGVPSLAGVPAQHLCHSDIADMHCTMEEEALWQEQVVTWSCQLVDALESLHQQGIVCGDLNPSNLLLDDNGEFSFEYRSYRCLLLQYDPTNRLGFGAKGADTIRSHPFFSPSHSNDHSSQP